MIVGHLFSILCAVAPKIKVRAAVVISTVLVALTDVKSEYGLITFQIYRSIVRGPVL